MRLLLPILTLVGAALAAPDADKDEKKEPTAGEVVIPDPGTPIADKAVARQQVERFASSFKAAADDAERVRLLEKLGGWDHPEVLKAASKHLRAKNEAVAVAAIIACARQSTSRAAAGRQLARVFASDERTPVACAAIVGLGRMGYDKRSTRKEIVKVFKRDTKETHKAAARYFGYVRDKSAFRMLAEKLDEPKNTLKVGETARPESYWRELWYEWKSNKPYVQWALSEIVPGETFETTDEARGWAETEGRKHGIRW
jgi:hypothetical protein